MKRTLTLLLAVSLLAPAAAVAATSTTKPTPKPTATKSTAKPSTKPTTKPTTKPKPSTKPAPIVKAPDCTKAKIVSVKVAAEGVFSAVDGVAPGAEPKLAVKAGAPVLILFDADKPFTAKLPGTATPLFKGEKGRSGVCVAANQLGKTLYSIDETGFVELTVSK